MADYIVTISNGTGSENLPLGLYNVTAAVTGYGGTLTPTTFTASSEEGSQAFTLAATGTLTLTVTDTGDEEGVPITSGSFMRCNANGSQTYGTAKTISGTGICVFNNVPYGTVQDPFEFYIIQITSDETHSIHEGVITVSMSDDEVSMYVKNSPAAEQSFTLTDAYYSGLDLSGTLTFAGPQV